MPPMISVRTFILTTSLALAAWLSASYLTEVDSPQPPAKDTALQQSGDNPESEIPTSPVATTAR